MSVQTKLTQVSIIVMLLLIGGCGSSSSDDSVEASETTVSESTDSDDNSSTAYSYAIADSAQNVCYNNNIEISCPTSSLDDFYGQDAQYSMVAHKATLPM